MYEHYVLLLIMNATTRRSVTIIALVAAALLAITGAILAARNSDSSAGTQTPGSTQTPKQGQPVDDPRAAEEEVGVARRDAADVTAIGDVDAPLVLIEYSDYRCPFCGVFARDTMPLLQAEYIDTGQLRFEWRDFPVFGEESMDGAMAARAAGEQDLYWEYHDAMYEDAPERGHLEIDRKRVLAWAEEVGVPDLAEFESDLEDPDLRAAIEADTAEARTLGASGTPTFLIGRTPLVGALPADEFRAAIDAQLEALGER